MDQSQLVSLSVTLLSGETVVLDDLLAGTRIADVKQRLRRQWTHLKEKSIQLSDGARMLRDAEVLQDVGTHLTVVVGEASTCTVEEAKQAIDAACRELGKGYSCKVVSWDDVCRGHQGSLSCGGPNITDSRLTARSGQSLYTVRSDNWNERLGRISADDLFVLARGQEEEELAPVSLREYLKKMGKYGGYAGLAPDADLADAAADNEVSIRFQTTFLPVLEDGSMEFCAEAYNYQTHSEDDPKNLVLLCTSQGTALQQQGPGNQRLFLHDLQADGRISRRWLEAQRTGHRVGGCQEESSEAAAAAAEVATAASEAAAQAHAAAEDLQQSGAGSAEAQEALRKAEEAEAASRQAAQEAAERSARAAEAEHAASEGKAVARNFGMDAMGSRCNMLMTVQVPLEQTAPPPMPSYSWLPPPPPPGSFCGIDLGATNARVAVWNDNDGATVLPNEHGHFETPCCVAVKDGQILVGDAVKGSGAPAEDIIYGVKRLLGRTWACPDLAEDLRHLPFRVIEGKGHFPLVIPVRWGDEEKLLSPEDVLVLILREIRRTVVTYTGIGEDQDIGAVISVPASFNDKQRQVTKLVAEAANFKVCRIINEPSAAAIAFGLDKQYPERNVVIIDMGGCTTDVNVMTIEDGIFEIKSTAGSGRLGGEDLDARLVEHCLAQVSQEHPDVDLRTRPRALRRLQTACERAKRTLSHSYQAQIDLEALIDDHDFSCVVTRARFEELVKEHLQHLLRLIQEALKDGGVPKEGIDEVVLVGGCARIPKLQEMVKEFFGKEPRISSEASHDVAKGAAIQAAVLCGYSGPVQDLLLLDVTPLSIGYESANGAMSRMIERNTTIPTRAAMTLTTHADNQQSVKLRIFEGERVSCKDNNFLGEVVLDGLPPAPRGVPQIKVVFDLDANGILHVTAHECSTGKSNSITVTNEKGRLTQSDIEEMIKAAEAANRGTAELPSAEEPAPAYGTSNAARVSQGSHEDYWPGLKLREPRRDGKQHCTITVQFYHTVSGGVPSPEDISAAIEDMESLYRHCEWNGRLAEKEADFAKSTG